MNLESFQKSFAVTDYDLAATLTSGQAFRWRFQEGAWESVIHSCWVRLKQNKNQITAQTVVPISDWKWLTDYLQLEVNLRKILSTGPAAATASRDRR